MADLMRHTAVWEGVAGLPGYSQFYHSVTDPISDSATNGSAAVRGFFNEFVSLIPDGITITVDPVYQIIDEITGQIVGEGVVTPAPQVVTGVYVGGWNRQVGLLVEWATGAFIKGRRLRGRTYLVPLGAIPESDGTLPSTTVAAVQASTAYIVNAIEDFRVWHRPVNSLGGSSATITAGLVRDKAAILNSRQR